jgi:hypothetical protein
MKASYVVLCLISFGGIGATPTEAQTLGDQMDKEGTAWVIGKWVLRNSPSEMNVNILHYEWDLDRHLVLMSMERQIDKYQYRGMMLFVPSKKEIVGMGADSTGGTCKVSWRTKDATLFHTIERTDAQGRVGTVEMVCTKVDNDTMKVDMALIVEEGGRRSAKPMPTGTYKREPPKAAAKEG